MIHVRLGECTAILPRESGAIRNRWSPAIHRIPRDMGGVMAHEQVVHVGPPRFLPTEHYGVPFRDRLPALATCPDAISKTRWLAESSYYVCGVLSHEVAEV